MWNIWFNFQMYENFYIFLLFISSIISLLRFIILCLIAKNVFSISKCFAYICKKKKKYTLEMTKLIASHIYKILKPVFFYHILVSPDEIWWNIICRTFLSWELGLTSMCWSSIKLAMLFLERKMHVTFFQAYKA